MLCFNKITGEKTLKGIAADKATTNWHRFCVPIPQCSANQQRPLQRLQQGTYQFVAHRMCFSCCFSSFTDSYVGVDGKLYYGIVTKTGLWCFYDPNAKSVDLSSYKLRMSDFVHAFFSTFVFGVVAMLDKNTVECFYPAFLKYQSILLKVLPTVVGAMASAVFMLFPDNRHGIGYPPSKPTLNFTQNDLHKDLLESGSQSFAHKELHSGIKPT